MLDFGVISFMYKAEFVGHGYAEKATIKLGCLNNLFDCKDSIPQDYLVLRISDYEVNRHSHPFTQLRNQDSIEGVGRKHVVVLFR
jgi:hypothetical protein